jgi:ABC-type nitrate/sulfonate/bicarbonate transport system permease component
MKQFLARGDAATNAGVTLMTGLAGLVIACALALLILILFSREAR